MASRLTGSQLPRSGVAMHSPCNAESNSMAVGLSVIISAVSHARTRDKVIWCLDMHLDVSLATGMFYGDSDPCKMLFFISILSSACVSPMRASYLHG
jgi:hypothetical protein